MQYLLSDNRLKYIYRLPLLICLILLAILISTFLSVDSTNYRNAFDFYNETSWSLFLNQLYEIELFHLLISKLYPKDQYLYIFSLITIISVSLKWFLIERTSRSFTASLSYYLAYFFVLLDCTQIRVSLAIVIAFWGIYFWTEKKHVIGITLLLGSGLFFHYALLSALALLFLTSKKITKYIIFSWFILIIAWCFGFTFIESLQNLISNINKNIIGMSKISHYLLRNDPNSHPYSLQFLALFFISIFIYLKNRQKITSFEIVCFNSLFLSFLILVIFTGESVLQNRLSEIFRFSLIFIFPLYYSFLEEIFPKRWQAISITGLILVSYFFYYIIGGGLIMIENLGFLIQK